MSESTPDSPLVARAWCPGCEPLADPISQILDLRYCDVHAPYRDGSDDERVTSEAYLSGSAEAGGDANRLWCDLLHRGRRATAAADTP